MKINRNAESHFAELPSADIQRSRFDRGHSVKFTGNVGEVLPFLCEPVLPGDTWDITTSKILRLQTLLSPVMDNMFLDIYYFFVPNRLGWQHWKQFMGENTDSAWLPVTQYQIPKIRIPYTGVNVGSLMDYLGFPPFNANDVVVPGSYVDVNALRLRAYLLVCDQWFRDQNYMQPLNISTGDASVTYDASQTELGGKPYIASKVHDYFTSVLPGPQKSLNPVQVPASGVLPVKTTQPGFLSFSPQYAVEYGSTSSANPDYKFSAVYTSASTGHSFPDLVNQVDSSGYAPINLVASSDPSGYNSSFLSMSVNDLRLAFQTQKFLEKQARGGSRYRELLLSHFGVVSPDARQQVPEYLGGNRVPLSVTQVVNSAQSSGERLGELGAYSQTTDIHSDVLKSFTEHGYILGVAVVRYSHTYSQFTDRDWYVNDLYDYYWPVFAAIGEQPVYTRELYGRQAFLDQSLPSPTVFGFQEAWASYRYAPDRCAGEMRPGVSNGLFSWSFADSYASTPVASAAWLREDVSNVNRVLAVSSSVSHNFWADFYLDCKVTRPMPVYSIPGLVDHF